MSVATTRVAAASGRLSGAGLPSQVPALAAVLVLFVLAVDAGVTAGHEGFGTAAVLRLGLLVGSMVVALCVTRFEYFLLGVLVVRPVLDIAKSGGGPPVLTSGVAALVVLGAILWLAAQASVGALRPVSGLGRLSVLLLACMSVSALASDERVRSTLQVARLAAAVAVLLVVEQLAVDRRARLRVLQACFLSSLVPMVVGLLQLATGSYRKSSAGLGRVTGTFLHPNAYGFYLVLLLVMGTALFRHLEGRTRLLVGLVLVGGTAELLLTYSRGSWAAVILGLLVVGALQSRKLLLLVPAGLAVLLVAVPSVITRLSDLSQTSTINGTPGNSFFWRIDHWAVVLRGAKGHELVGIGPGGADFLGVTVLPPHNDFVRMFVETGVLGTVVYLAVLLAALAVCVHGLRVLHTAGLERGIAVGAFACTIAFVVGSAGGNLISEVVVLLYMFAFLGAAASATVGATTSPPGPTADGDRRAAAPERVPAA